MDADQLAPSALVGLGLSLDPEGNNMAARAGEFVHKNTKNKSCASLKSTIHSLLVLGPRTTDGGARCARFLSEIPVKI